MSLQTNDTYDGLFDYYGQIYNVDPRLTKTAFQIESSGNPNTRDSAAGAQGGMQIMPALAQHYGIDPHDMTQAIPAATAYLAEGLQATGGDPAGALAYYNGGPKSLQRWQPETQQYVAKAQSLYPQIQLTQLAANGPPSGTATDTPAQYADASAPNEQAFRSRWGLPGAPASSPSNESAFRSRWGLPAPGVAASPAPVGTRPVAASDAAASAPDNLGDTAMTTAQLAASQARAAQGPYSALEPSEPGLAHLLWSLGALPMQIGETALGYRPVPTGPGTTALGEASVGAGLGDLRLGNPLVLNRPATGNPLANAPQIEAPAPPFSTGGRTFEVDAQGNVTQSGLPSGRPPVQPAVQPTAGEPPALNPLTSRAATPPSPGTPLAPASGTALTPAEELGYAAMRSRPGSAISGVLPPGAPPPGSTPGYAPTTPGINPAAAPGLSPAEIAAYASMHDSPPPAPLLPPQTKAQAEALADRIVQYFHTGNAPVASADLVVPPGYHPTLTGLTNDPGLATLHRGLESVSGTPAVIAQHNAQAINTAAAQLQGEPGDVAAMEAARDAQTAPMREAAFSNATEADPAKVQAVTTAANKILSGPDGKRPGVIKYVAQIRDALSSQTGNGAPETNPEMLYGVHKAVNDLLSPLAQSTDADKQAASASLMKLKPLLQSAIESGAPGFKAYMQKYADLSKPIDAQRFLQSLNLTNATGDVRLQAVDSAIKNIAKQQQLPGAPKAKWVTDQQLGQLQALRNALRMEAARGTGKPINSTTFQNLATNSIVSRIAGNPLISGIGAQFASPGIAGFIMGQAASVATKQALERSESLVRDALLERILNFSGKGEATLANRPPPEAPGASWNPLRSGPPPPGTSTPGAPWNRP